MNLSSSQSSQSSIPSIPSIIRYNGVLLSDKNRKVISIKCKREDESKNEMNNSNIVRTDTLMNASANSSLSSPQNLSAELAKAKLVQDMVRELMFGSDGLGETEKITTQIAERVETPVKLTEKLIEKPTEKQEILKETTVKTNKKQKIQKVSQQNTSNSTPVHAKNAKNVKNLKAGKNTNVNESKKLKKNRKT